MPLRFVARPGIPTGLPLGILAVVGIVAVKLLSAAGLPLSICMFKYISGLPCLTCGGTRAAMRLARLDLAGAFLMNPLVVTGGALLVPWALGDLVLSRRQMRVGVEVEPAAKPWIRGGIVALAVLNCAYLVAAGR